MGFGGGNEKFLLFLMGRKVVVGVSEGESVAMKSWFFARG